MKRFRRIMLLDDDEATNFYHRIIIEQAEITEEIRDFSNVDDGINYLKTLQDDGMYPQPAIIFLDINMPGKTGWDFLTEYEQLQTDQQAEVVVVMLTTSDDPEDKIRADQFSAVKGFKTKPLTAEMLKEIIAECF